MIGSLDVNFGERELALPTLRRQRSGVIPAKSGNTGSPA
jgi:hypothetical protein